MKTLDAATAVDLARRIGAGDEQAETELVERCGGALRFLAFRFTRNDSDAEDLYQETLMVALQRLRGREVREPERLGGFLRALAKNLATGRYRRRSYQAESASEAPPDAPDERQPDALGGLLHLERTRLTRRLLADLAVPRDRDVLFRYYIGEESSESICADLQLEPEHFHRVLHRARQRYRRLWEERVALA